MALSQLGATPRSPPPPAPSTWSTQAVQRPPPWLLLLQPSPWSWTAALPLCLCSTCPSMVRRTTDAISRPPYLLHSRRCTLLRASRAGMSKKLCSTSSSGRSAMLPAVGAAARDLTVSDQPQGPPRSNERAGGWSPCDACSAAACATALATASVKKARALACVARRCCRTGSQSGEVLGPGPNKT